MCHLGRALEGLHRYGGILTGGCGAIFAYTGGVGLSTKRNLILNSNSTCYSVQLGHQPRCSHSSNHIYVGGLFIGDGKERKRRRTSDKDPSSFNMNSRNKYFV